MRQAGAVVREPNNGPARCWALRLSRWFCRRVTGQFPAWEYQHAGVTFQRLRQQLGTLNSKTHTIVLDSRDTRLGDFRKLQEAVLAQLLKLAEKPHRFANGYCDPLLRCTVFLRLQPSVIMRRDRSDLEEQILFDNSVDHAPLIARSIVGDGPCDEICVVAYDAGLPGRHQELRERTLPSLVSPQRRDQGISIERRHVQHAGDQRCSLWPCVAMRRRERRSDHAAAM